MFLFSWSITSQLPSEDYPTRWHYSPPLVSRNGPRGGHCAQVSSRPSLSVKTINYLIIINHLSSIQRAWSLDWIYQPDAWPATSIGVPFLFIIVLWNSIINTYSFTLGLFLWSCIFWWTSGYTAYLTLFLPFTLRPTARLNLITRALYANISSPRSLRGSTTDAVPDECSSTV